MKIAVYDIETNGVNFRKVRATDQVETVHCLVIRTWYSGGLSNADELRFRGPSIVDGLAVLDDCDILAGHNVIGFDNPVLRNVYRWAPKARVVDTKVLSELCYGSDLRWKDTRKVEAGLLDMPRHLLGRHSLESWGYRLGGALKDDYSKRCKEQGIDPWAEWSQEMEDYCAQDVEVNERLLKLLDMKLDITSRLVAMECALAEELQLATYRGWAFDTKAAGKLYAELSAIRESIRVELEQTFGDFWLPDGQQKVAKKTLRYKDVLRPDLTEGVPYQPIKMVKFNPGSDDHIILALRRRYGWEPVAFTDKGKPKMDEPVLRALPYPEAEPLLRYKLVDKRIGQLAEGDKAWLKKEHSGRIHGEYNQNGTRTGRMSHKNPNIGQVPRVGSAYGAECRSLFRATDGFVMVGADASGIELRMLSHYTFPLDRGLLAEAVLEGDVHTENANAISEAVGAAFARDPSKTFIYACLYGAQDPKLGSIVLDACPDLRGRDSRKLGKLARDAVNRRFPGFHKLSEGVRAKAKKTKTIKAIDGRTLYGVSGHTGLNTLLQGSAGILMKAACPDAMLNIRLRLTMDCFLLGHIHDEMQVECRPDYAEDVGEMMVASIQATGINYGLRVPLDGEYKIGQTWAETH